MSRTPPARRIWKKYTCWCPDASGLVIPLQQRHAILFHHLLAQPREMRLHLVRLRAAATAAAAGAAVPTAAAAAVAAAVLLFRGVRQVLRQHRQPEMPRQATDQRPDVALL